MSEFIDLPFTEGEPIAIRFANDLTRVGLVPVGNDWFYFVAAPHVLSLEVRFFEISNLELRMDPANPRTATFAFNVVCEVFHDTPTRRFGEADPWSVDVRAPAVFALPEMPAIARSRYGALIRAWRAVSLVQAKAVDSGDYNLAAQCRVIHIELVAKVLELRPLRPATLSGASGNRPARVAVTIRPQERS